jgi:endogenous inhibitor of DNA gyrase (YacG/DUF329 family)
MKIKCPKCKKEVDWEGNEWRPFCSERCKMVDLGAWVSESYSIEGDALEDSGHDVDTDNDEDGYLH